MKSQTERELRENLVEIIYKLTDTDKEAYYYVHKLNKLLKDNLLKIEIHLWFHLVCEKLGSK